MIQVKVQCRKLVSVFLMWHRSYRLGLYIKCCPVLWHPSVSVTALRESRYECSSRWLNRLVTVWFLWYWWARWWQRKYGGKRADSKQICSWFAKGEIEYNNLMHVNSLAALLSGLVGGGDWLMQKMWKAQCLAQHMAEIKPSVYGDWCLSW